MASLSRALRRVQQDCRQYLPDRSILSACRTAGHKWRDRKLGPVETIHLFILQVLWFNTAMTHLQHLAAETITAAAYCKARMRLPLAALQQLLRDSSAVMRQASGSEGLWCSLRVLLVDGSCSITPDTPALRKAFGQPSGQKKGCGFPVPKVLGLLDAFSGLIIEMLVFPLFTHEQSQVWKLHPLLKGTDLILGDRGFCSYIHLAMLSSCGVQACFRLHQRHAVDFRPHRKSRDQSPKGKRKGRPISRFVRRLGKHDQVVRWKKPTLRPTWISDSQWEATADWMEIRELRYTLPRRGQRTFTVTLATTLLDPVSWIASNNVAAGNEVNLNLPEMGISGEAEVTSITACPTIESGSGQVVLGTFEHVSNDVVDVNLVGESQPMQVTANHEIWSLDTGGWVEAGQLYAGERLAGANGPVIVGSVTPDSQSMPVYNLDVENDHCYLVTDLGVLVHNTCPNPAEGDGLNVVPRAGMAENTILDKDGQPVSIYGQTSSSSTTPGHATTMQSEAERLADAGDVKFVTMQRSWRTATGRVNESRDIPDIIVVNKNGTVNAYEIPSQSQNTVAGRAALLQQLRDDMALLPAANQGTVGLILIGP